MALTIAGQNRADFPAAFFHISHWYLSWNTTDKSKSQESVEEGNELVRTHPIFHSATFLSEEYTNLLYSPLNQCMVKKASTIWNSGQECTSKHLHEQL